MTLYPDLRELFIWSTYIFYILQNKNKYQKIIQQQYISFIFVYINNSIIVSTTFIKFKILKNNPQHNKINISLVKKKYIYSK